MLEVFDALVFNRARAAALEVGSCRSHSEGKEVRRKSRIHLRQI